MKRIADNAAGLIRAGHRLLTKDLIQALGEVDPGKASESLNSDETASMVSGFCSTGYGLNIHLEDGHAINLSADPIHGDSATQQPTTTSHVAAKQSFGLDAPPYTCADFEESDTLVFIGANPSLAHPVLWQRVMQNKHSPEIIVIDPHKTETAMAATQYYAIQPKSDLTLLYGIANILIASGWIYRPYIDTQTNSFDEFSQLVTHFTTDIVSAATGLDADNIWHLAQTIADGKRVFFWWTMKVNQVDEATRTAQAVVNLALMTGNNGRPL